LAGILGFGGTYLAEGPFKAVSGRYQLVKESPQAALFGDGEEVIGAPQVFVVFDRSAVLGAEGEGGIPRLSLTALEKKKVYPLQLVTVLAIMDGARLAFFGLACLGGLVAVAASRSRE
jgi:hypothetical protein